MAITVTSVTPLTGTTLGGTSCTVVGTGLDTVLAVLVDNKAAAIVGTPTATGLVFKTPAGTVGAAKSIRFLDAASDVVAGSTFTYTVPVTAELLVTTLARKFRIEVMVGEAWTKVRGIKTMQPAVSPTMQDDSDYDSDGWASKVKTMLAWELKFTIKRGTGILTGLYDPAQEAIRTAEDKFGPAGVVQARWFDRDGGAEAYTGYAQVGWSPKGGGADALDEVDVTLTGQGGRTVIANPVIADPTLAA